MTLRIAAALLVAFTATIAFAQSSDVVVTPADASVSAAEYGRTSGGELRVLTRHSNGFSGSIGISRSAGSLAGRNGYEATFGGTAIADHLWFFGSAQQTSVRSISPYAGFLPQQQLSKATVQTGDVKLSADMFDRHSFAGTLSTGQSVSPSTNLNVLPSTFLSLHYTGVISPNAFVTATVTQQK